MSAVLPLTRTILILGVGLTAGTGAALYLFPGRTEDYWAWPIAAEPSAAFFGAGFLGAAVALGLAARERTWQRVRSIFVVAFALTLLALLVTLLEPEPFALDGRGLPRSIAWVWLAVYVALPPLVLVAFLRQERAGGRQEYGGAWARRPTQLAAGVAGAFLAFFGVGLLAGWGRAESWWPWPLTPLTAGVLGAWLTTYGVGLLWFAGRDRSWRRSRIGAIALAVTGLLDLGAAVRLWNDLDGGATPVIYVVVLVALVAGVGTVAVWEGSRAEPGLEAP